MLSDAFTNFPGASKTFIGGVVCYANEVKVEQVCVPESILEQHGAVSPECAIAMATGISERLGSDYGLSVTGFAGPEGGNKDNPVGTIHLGYHSPVGVWSKTLRYTGGRLDVKARAVHAALDWMRRKLRKEPDPKQKKSSPQATRTSCDKDFKRSNPSFPSKLLKRTSTIP